jgi:hypothetical protein
MQQVDDPLPAFPAKETHMPRNLKRTLPALRRSSLIITAGFAMALATSGQSFAQGAAGSTLQASKTIEICLPDQTITPNTWQYSGDVSVWNNGTAPTSGLQIVDNIEKKLGSKPWQTFLPNVPLGPDPTGVVIPGNTPEGQAFIFHYNTTGPAITDGSSIRNNAQVTITNHSGSKVNGPNPKATYSGTVPPPACQNPNLGCALTQGFWKNHTETWPTGYDPGALFFLSGQSWIVVLNTSVNTAPGYYQLADQYIAAVLNIANGAFEPSGIADIITQSEAFFNNNTPSACSSSSACGLQKTWAAILNDYNNGTYTGGPPHCGG